VSRSDSTSAADPAAGLDPPPLPSQHYPPKGHCSARGLIIVRNGEQYIGSAVASLAWCATVLVIDQESTDATAKQAAMAGATVRSTAPTGVVEPARREAISQLGPGWIVTLDADEVCPPALARTIARIIDEGRFDGVAVPRRNYILGEWAKGAGWWPDYQVRAFRAELVDAPARLHYAIRLHPGGRVLTLDPSEEGALLHFNYVGLTDWVERTNRYTSVAAAELRLERARPIVAAGRAFVRRYVRESGWRLGRYGLKLSAMMAVYDWLLVEKCAEVAAGAPDTVVARYQALARRTIED
jgi:glycosyltransferase involved in cell wall biosynthesis